MSRYYGFGQEKLPVPGSDIRQEPTASPLMPVDEMGALLGLKKTEQYWLVHKNVFDTRTFVGRIWIVRDSFERWYWKTSMTQTHAPKKLAGSNPAPGISL